MERGSACLDAVDTEGHPPVGCGYHHLMNNVRGIQEAHIFKHDGCRMLLIG